MHGVSVIITTCSRPRQLARAVESARAAAGAGVEIVVVDDASTGETAEVCKGLAGVRYVRLERRQGAAGARNVGLLASAGEYVAFLDEDERRLPGSLDLQVAALEANPEAGFCCGPVLFADSEGRPTGEVSAPRAAEGAEFFWSLLRLDFFVRSAGVVVRRGAVLAAGLPKPRLEGIDEWDLCVRLAELFPVATVSGPVGVCRRPAPGFADFARDSLRLLRRQRELLKLPLAAAATPGERRRVRRQTVRRLAGMLFQMRGQEAGTGREIPGAARAGSEGAGCATWAVGGETVSVIIATHDRPHLVPRAVESALAAGRDVEVVVVDDASPTDETEEVCRRYEGVRYFRLARNQRLGGARNVGILLSRGAFITFLDDDDTRLPGSIDAQRDTLLADPAADMAYGQAVLEWAPGDSGPERYPEECPEGDIFWQLMERNFVPCPAVLFRREVLFRVGLPHDTTPSEDWDCWLRIAEVGRVLATARPVATYRKGNPRSGQVTSGAARMVRELTGVYRNSWQRLERARADDARRRRAWRAFSYNMATHLVWETGRALRHGRFQAAARNLWTALSLHPLATLRRAFTPDNARFLKKEFAKLLS
jgi:glycosyltransferase involved in cell wall biosynthesis